MTDPYRLEFCGSDGWQEEQGFATKDEAVATATTLGRWGPFRVRHLGRTVAWFAVARPLDEPCPHCDMQHVWPCPTIPRCDEPGCEQEATCGWPTRTGGTGPNGGYRRTCGPHMRAYPGGLR